MKKGLTTALFLTIATITLNPFNNNYKTSRAIKEDSTRTEQRISISPFNTQTNAYNKINLISKNDTIPIQTGFGGFGYLPKNIDTSKIYKAHIESGEDTTIFNRKLDKITPYETDTFKIKLNKEIELKEKGLTSKLN